MTITITATDDAALLSELYETAFDKTWAIDDLTRRLNHPSTEAFIACLDDQPCGVVMYQTTPDSADLWYIATLPTAQRKGIARALWNEMIITLKHASIPQVMVEVSVNNFAAIALYKALGCTAISTRKQYYSNDDGTFDDALVMRYKLT